MEQTTTQQPQEITTIPKPQKLVRHLVPKLYPDNEYGTIEDRDELNHLYVMKVREELEEVVNSNFKDVKEFADLIQVALTMAVNNGFSIDDVYRAVKLKSDDRGRFSNITLRSLNPENPSNRIYFRVKMATKNFTWDVCSTGNQDHYCSHLVFNDDFRLVAIFRVTSFKGSPC